MCVMTREKTEIMIIFKQKHQKFCNAMTALFRLDLEKRFDFRLNRNEIHIRIAAKITFRSVFLFCSIFYYRFELHFFIVCAKYQIISVGVENICVKSRESRRSAPTPPLSHWYLIGVSPNSPVCGFSESYTLLEGTPEGVRRGGALPYSGSNSTFIR